MREQLLDDLDLFEYTESFNEFDVDLNQTLDDVELESLDAELEEIDEQEKVNKCDDPDFAYLPCAAHNIQLVVKDGLKLDKTYTLLIKKITWIVAKAKTCSSISEELQQVREQVCCDSLEQHIVHDSVCFENNSTRMGRCEKQNEEDHFQPGTKIQKVFYL